MAGDPHGDLVWTLLKGGKAPGHRNFGNALGNSAVEALEAPGPAAPASAPTQDGERGASEARQGYADFLAGQSGTDSGTTDQAPSLPVSGVAGMPGGTLAALAVQSGLLGMAPGPQAGDGETQVGSGNGAPSTGIPSLLDMAMGMGNTIADQFQATMNNMPADLALGQDFDPGSESTSTTYTAQKGDGLWTVARSLSGSDPNLLYANIGYLVWNGQAAINADGTSYNIPLGKTYTSDLAGMDDDIVQDYASLGHQYMDSIASVKAAQTQAWMDKVNQDDDACARAQLQSVGASSSGSQNSSESVGSKPQASSSSWISGGVTGGVSGEVVIGGPVAAGQVSFSTIRGRDGNWYSVETTGTSNINVAYKNGDSGFAADIGADVGFQFGNAKNGADLSGDARTRTLSIWVLQLQLSTNGSGIWSVNAMAGLGLGAGVSSYKTTAVVTKIP